MPRVPTRDVNAEFAVSQFQRLVRENRWGRDRGWLAVAKLLITCQVWEQRRGWTDLYGQPVLVESNAYGLNVDGSPNAELLKATKVGIAIAAELDVAPNQIPSELGEFFTYPSIRRLQPNNPRGNAFRSIVAAFVAEFGDPQLTVQEEVSPLDLFPGFTFNTRSKRPKLDVAFFRGTNLVAFATTRWTYRHDRVDIIEEALAYMPAARRLNPRTKFFGVTCEFSEARLKKVLAETAPARDHSSIERLVHVCPEYASTLLGRNGVLNYLWSLERLAEDSYSWR